MTKSNPFYSVMSLELQYLFEWEHVSTGKRIVNTCSNTSESLIHYKLHHKFNDLAELMERQLAIDITFGDTMEEVFEDLNPNDIVSATIKNPSIPYKIYLAPQSVKDFDTHPFFDRLYTAVEAIPELLIGGVLDVRVTVIRCLKY